MENTKVTMQQLHQEKSELAAKYFEQMLASELYPTHKLSDHWKDIAERAVLRTPPMHVKVSLVDFQYAIAGVELLNRGKDISLYQFGVISNCIETRSAWELGLDINQYESYLTEVIAAIGHYSQRMQIIRAEATKKAADEINMKATKLSEHGGLMKPIKAEA